MWFSCRGVGKWILKQMKEFFDTDSGDSGIENIPQKGENFHTAWLQVYFFY